MFTSPMKILLAQVTAGLYPESRSGAKRHDALGELKNQQIIASRGATFRRHKACAYR